MYGKFIGKLMSEIQADPVASNALREATLKSRSTEIIIPLGDKQYMLSDKPPTFKSKKCWLSLFFLWCRQHEN